MGTTKIEWADAVWNPATGCTKVSAGCANCYAEVMARRFGREGFDKDDRPLGVFDFRVLIHPDRLDQPLHWRKPRRVFVCSMGDLFHEDVPDSFIYDVLNVAVAAQRHTFMVLTKRPKRMQRIMVGRKLPMPANLWLGVSDEGCCHGRIDYLRATPAALRFVSFEPLLCDPRTVNLDGIGLVICGGETGNGARGMDSKWARSLRDQCSDAGVPFFFKHHGSWHDRRQHDNSDNQGRLLDGREWNQFPK